MLLIKSARDALSVHKRMQQLCAQKVLNYLVEDPWTECQQHWHTWALLSGTLHVLQQRSISESDRQWNGLYLGMAQHWERPWVAWGQCDGVHRTWTLVCTRLWEVFPDGNHIDWTKQATTSCSHPCAGIRTSTTMDSTKRSSKRNYLRLPQWAKTWDAWPALLQVKTS